MYACIHGTGGGLIEGVSASGHRSLLPCAPPLIPALHALTLVGTL
jgi:hypothetical protein